MKKKLKAPKPSTVSKRTPSSKAGTSSTASPSKWTRIDRPFPLPGYVKEALERLDHSGHVAYIVGGSVRDFFLGRTVKDFDIATSANPDELCELFPNAITVGKAFGVLKIPLQVPAAGTPFLEIATFREDLEYLDHRHPKSVRFAGPEEDAGRRDFTINALFFDPKTSRVLDPTGGFQDLNGKVLRAIGTPKLRFKEDALRLLRGVRFSASLGFTIEAVTLEAMKEKARLITHVSAERIRDELNLVLTGPRPAEALESLSKLQILKHILPELEALKGITQSPIYHPEGDAWTHTLKAVRCLTTQHSTRSPTLAWGTLLHDVGKPAAAQRNKGESFNGHEVDSGKIAFQIAQRLKMSAEDADQIKQMALDHLKFKDVFSMRDSTLERFIRQPHFDELLALHRADSSASDGNLAFYEFCANKFQAHQRGGAPAAPRLVDGNDLIQLGLSPGPGFTDIIRTIEDLALEKKLETKEAALEYIVKHFVH